jgi:hypothetical protein
LSSLISRVRTSRVATMTIVSRSRFALRSSATFTDRRWLKLAWGRGAL